jgi:imidazolonepropionase-like amidohydrolase
LRHHRLPVSEVRDRSQGIAEGIATGPEQFRDAVRFQIKYGADVIKVCATGGVLSLGDDVGAPQLTQAEMDALVDEAHRLGRRVAAHAHGARARRSRSAAGIDSIEHGSFLDDEAVRMMKERGTYLVPTLMAGEYAGGRKATRKYPPEIASKATQALDGRSTAFKRAVAAGVKIAFGTDSGVSPHWPQRRGVRAARRARPLGSRCVENRTHRRDTARHRSLTGTIEQARPPTSSPCREMCCATSRRPSTCGS